MHVRAGLVSNDSIEEVGVQWSCSTCSGRSGGPFGRCKEKRSGCNGRGHGRSSDGSLDGGRAGVGCYYTDGDDGTTTMDSTSIAMDAMVAEALS